MADSVNVNITQKQFGDLSKDFVLDLTALFNVMQDELIEILDRAEAEEWTPEQLISEVEAKI